MNGFSVQKVGNGYTIEVWSDNPMKDSTTYVFEKSSKVLKAVKKLLMDDVQEKDVK